MARPKLALILTDTNVCNSTRWPIARARRRILRGGPGSSSRAELVCRRSLRLKVAFVRIDVVQRQHLARLNRRPLNLHGHDQLDVIVNLNLLLPA
jgi:hypothetical protein